MSPMVDIDDDEPILQPLTVPQFVSQIPEDLTESLSKRERHSLATLSIIAQRQDFFLGILEEHHRAMMRMEVRQIKYAKFLRFIASKWGVASWIFLSLMPFVFSKVITKIFP